MHLIRYKDSMVVNLAQVTHIELNDTSTQYRILFYHHFTYTEESFRGVLENFHESVWYFDLKDERDSVYENICSKYVDSL